jgi:hypothetical protein
MQTKLGSGNRASILGWRTPEAISTMLTVKKKKRKIKGATGRLKHRIDVTPEMIQAGVLRLFDYDPRFGNEEDIVQDIFRAMYSRSRKDKHP